MKRTLTTLLSLALIGLTLNGLMAQEAEKPRQMRIMLNKNVNGVETAIDTTITLQPGQDPAEVMQSLGMEAPGGAESRVLRMKLGDGQEMELDGQSLEGLEFDVDVDQQSDGSMKIKITRDGETKVIEATGDGNWTTDEGTVIRFDSGDATFTGEDGQIQVIHMGSEPGEHNINVEVTGEGADRKVIINRNGEVQEIPLGEDNVWVGEDGESDEGMKVFRFSTDDGEHVEHIQSDHKMIMINDENLSEEQKAQLEEAMQSGDHNTLMIRIKEVLGDDADAMEVNEVRMVRIEIKIEEPDADDMDMLRDSGAGELNNSLQLDELSFFPNPSNGQFSLQFQAEEEGPMQITVRDLQGRTVYSETESEFRGMYQNDIDISGESAGVYFLTITVNGRSMTKKLVME